MITPDPDFLRDVADRNAIVATALGPDPVSTIVDIVAEIESITPRSAPLIPGRYPFTYAYDFMRGYAEAFRLPPHVSRGQCAMVLRAWCEKSGEDLESVLIRLADAYLRENRISKASVGGVTDANPPCRCPIHGEDSSNFCRTHAYTGCTPCRTFHKMPLVEDD